MELVKKSLIFLYIVVILLGGIGFFLYIILFFVIDIMLGCSLFVCIVFFCVVLIGKEGLVLGCCCDYGIVIGLGVLMVVYWIMYFVFM